MRGSCGKARQRGREALRRCQPGRRRPVHSVFPAGSASASDEAGHVKGGFFLFSHSSVSPCVGSLSEVFNDTGETRRMLTIRVTDEEHARLLARCEGKQLASWMRKVCLGAPPSKTSGLPTLAPPLLRQFASVAIT